MRTFCKKIGSMIPGTPARTHYLQSSLLAFIPCRGTKDHIMQSSALSEEKEDMLNEHGDCSLLNLSKLTPKYLAAPGIKLRFTAPVHIKEPYASDGHIARPGKWLHHPSLSCMSANAHIRNTLHACAASVELLDFGAQLYPIATTLLEANDAFAPMLPPYSGMSSCSSKLGTQPCRCQIWPSMPWRASKEFGGHAEPAKQEVYQELKE